MTRLYTLGIGLYKGPHIERKEAFQDRINRLTEKLGPLQVVDIRRYACGSRNGRKWFGHPADQGVVGIAKTLELPGVTYEPIPALSKPKTFGNTQAELLRYDTWLKERIKQYPAVTEQFHAIQKVTYLYKTFPAVVLMCSEKVALTGKSIKCHRVFVGRLISERTGCDVIHLPGDNDEEI